MRLKVLAFEYALPLVLLLHLYVFQTAFAFASADAFLKGVRKGGFDEGQELLDGTCQYDLKSVFAAAWVMLRLFMEWGFDNVGWWWVLADAAGQ